MPEKLIRIHPAPRHNRIRCAYSNRFAKPHADCVYIILLKERICNDVEYVTAVIVPVIHSKPESGIFNLVCQPAITFQNLRNRIPVSLFHSPELNITGIYPCSGVRNIKYVTDFRIISRIIYERNSVLSKLDIMTEDDFEDAIFKGLEDINAD